MTERARVTVGDDAQVEALLNQRHDKTRQVVLGHEVVHIRRQELRLIDLPGAKVLAHGTGMKQTRGQLNSDYSRRLLGATLPARGHDRPIDLHADHGRSSPASAEP